MVTRRMTRTEQKGMSGPKSQVSKFIAKYSPSVASQFRAARSSVRAHFPRGYELVYDNYNALGCGFSTSPRASDVLVSVVAYPNWVTLFFFRGVRLSDPDGILQGSGSRIRSLRLVPPSLLSSKPVQALLKQAIAQVRDELAVAPAISTIVKSVSAKQRPRRPVAKPVQKTAAAQRVRRVA
jgi:hypothetical protein